jgi:hypothetical protein
MNVFISYAPADAELAGRIADVLKASGFQVWDDSQILPGDNWGVRLAQALEEAEAMVVVLTPHSLRSPNVSREVGYALGNKDYKDRVIPVIAAPPDQLPQEDIPWVLNRFQVIHLQDDDRDKEGLERIAQVLQAAA